MASVVIKKPKTKILVHSCGETHTFQGCKIVATRTVLEICEIDGVRLTTVSMFKDWDWWREIEEDSNG